jgi:hypothetical protein
MGSKILTTENTIDDFHLVYAQRRTSQIVFVEKLKKAGCGHVDFLQATGCRQKCFIVGRKNRVMLVWHAYTKFLTTDLNNSFYSLGYVELWKRSQKIGGI